jgi:hypothetical protein
MTVTMQLIASVADLELNVESERRREIDTHLDSKKVKQSRYRPRVAQRVPGS